MSKEIRFTPGVSGKDAVSLFGGRLPSNEKLTSEEKAFLVNFEETITEYRHLRWFCDFVKARRGGSYPPDWYSFYVQSGLVHKILYGTT